MLTRRQRRDRHTASRHRGWALFMGLLTSPLGGYLYVGRPWRLLAFLGLFAGGMAFTGFLVEHQGLPLWVADVAAFGMGLAALADQWWLIGACRRTLHAQGLSFEIHG